jgi:hypothetical protein
MPGEASVHKFICTPRSSEAQQTTAMAMVSIIAGAIYGELPRLRTGGTAS